MKATSDQPHILVVEDEPELREVLRRGLEAEGFIVVEAANKATLFRRLNSYPIKLITLDLGLGQQDGLELALEIRAAHNVPIVMITGRDAPLDRVAGLEHGADDYITKPFHIREVSIRVRSVLARYGILGGNAIPGRVLKTEEPHRYAFDVGVFDVLRRELKTTNGAFIDLTETEFRVLELFLKHPGRVLSRDEIMQMLKGQDWDPLDRVIDGHVARLRRKLEASNEELRMIKSVRGVGYVFTGDVRRV
ncbi:MAG TPA: response regulator transcription factor [Xanthobacteraceae bacterium]|nr:response regulator transcription factor [Xanthobacteraceae bacterium]